MTREAFIERVWAWKEQSGGTISRQLRRLGASVDWSRERFTMDPGLSQAVIEAFVRLHEQGLIYRGERLVNWDPVLRTALSDLEVLSEEEDGQLWYLRYPLSDGDGHVVVATTRPETMLGDAAVAVNAEDPRYRHLIGRRVKLPLTEREIPIIADSFVDPAFGSGCVKITPAHDFNDYAIGLRHGLPLINIFTPEARLNELAPVRMRPLGRVRSRTLRARELGQDLLPMDAQYPGLVHQSPALVGPSHPRLVRRAGQYLCRSLLRAGARGRARAPRPGRAAATGRGRARYLVLLRAVALLDPGLAGAAPGARAVLPDRRARDRLRHHLLLGRTHDHARAEVHGRRAVPRSLRAWADSRCGRPEDVEVQGQRDRSARYHRRHRAAGAGGQAHQRIDAAASGCEHRKGDAQAIPRGHCGLWHRCAALHLRLARHPKP